MNSPQLEEQIKAETAAERASTLPVVMRQKTLLLNHLRQYSPQPSLDDVSPEDVAIELMPGQGNANATYTVRAGDVETVLSVPLKVFHANRFGTHPTDRQAFKTYLQQEGFPVVGRIGDSFTLGAWEGCQLHPFCYGRCYNNLSELQPVELASYATNLAGMHNAGAKFRAPHSIPFFTKTISRQNGFIHDDLHCGNVIFGDEGQVKGILDFEFSRFGSFMDDLFQALRDEMHVTPERTIECSVAMTEFLHFYHQERALAPDDIRQFADITTRTLLSKDGVMSRLAARDQLTRALSQELAPLAETKGILQTSLAL